MAAVKSVALKSVLQKFGAKSTLLVTKPILVAKPFLVATVKSVGQFLVAAVKSVGQKYGAKSTLLVTKPILESKSFLVAARSSQICRTKIWCKQ